MISSGSESFFGDEMAASRAISYGITASRGICRTLYLLVLLAGFATPATAAPIAPGQTLTQQRFEWQNSYSSRSSGTYGQYEITLEAGVEYVISTSNPQGGNTRDTYLYLLNSGLSVIASDDDSGGNQQSRLIFRPTIAGNYYIRLRAYSRGNYGFCSLSVASTPPEALPDLVIWGPSASPRITTTTFTSTSCAVVEGMVQEGTRKLLRFSSEMRNQGAADLYLGNPATNPQFQWAPCHGHYHFGNYANYRLLNSSGAEAARGLKVGFCLLDTVRWDPNASSQPRYTCSNQGIQKGWSDIYDSTLDGQWIDITGLPDGNYTLEVAVNPQRTIVESNYDNNITRIPVSIGSVRPANDNFASANGLSGSSASVSASNIGATKESGEPNHAGFSAARSIWYFWTAPSSTIVTIDTVGSNFDTLLAVYTGTSVSALAAVASNDDLSSSSRQSRVTFAPVAGRTYRIAIDGWDAQTGSIVLTLNQNPFNDSFAACEFIGGSTGTTTDSNRSATKEPGEPNHAGDPGGHSIWYCWTAPNTGSVTFDTVGSTFDTLLAVYTGNSLGSLTHIASNDDLNHPSTLQSRVTFNATGTTHYHIAIDGWNGASGNTTLNWRMGGTMLASAAMAETPTSNPDKHNLAAALPIVNHSFAAGGQFGLSITGQPLRRYTVEVSCDLLRWLPLATTLSDARGNAYFRDKAVTGGASEVWCAPSATALPAGSGAAKPGETRFYRVVEAE